VAMTPNRSTHWKVESIGIHPSITPVAYSIFDDLGVTTALPGPMRRLRWWWGRFGHAGAAAPFKHLVDAGTPLATTTKAVDIDNRVELRRP
jgi:hypothetical protein